MNPYWEFCVAASFNSEFLRLCCTKFNIHVNLASTLFSSQRQERQNSNIAILHPRKLVIYTLVTSTGFAEHGNVKCLCVPSEDCRLNVLRCKITILNFFCLSRFRPTVKITNFTSAWASKVRVYNVQGEFWRSKGQRVYLRHVPWWFTEIFRARRN